MELLICNDPMELAQRASMWCETKAVLHAAKSIYLPAGKTPENLYAIWNTQRPKFLSSMELLQVDEIITGSKQFHFRKFLINHLQSFSRQIVPVEAERSVATIGVLGLGLNGHVAFHEPGIDPEMTKGVVQLSQVTALELGIDIGDLGLTYGLGAFRKCKSLLLLVSGERKKEIFQKLQENFTELPASHLLNHPDITILADRSVC